MECYGCNRKDCGSCTNCKDMKKFGGQKKKEMYSQSVHRKGWDGKSRRKYRQHTAKKTDRQHTRRRTEGQCTGTNTTTIII